MKKLFLLCFSLLFPSLVWGQGTVMYKDKDQTVTAHHTFTNGAAFSAGAFTVTDAQAISWDCQAQIAQRFYVITCPPYGALGNGSDDLAHVQAAVDAAVSAGGGQIIIPPGTFTISGTITATTPISFVGAGQGVSIITTSSATLDMLSLTGTAQATVSDLTLKTNLTRTGGAGILLKCTGCGGGNYNVGSQFHHLRIESFMGIDVERACCFQITENQFGTAVNGFGVIVRNSAAGDAGDGLIANNVFSAGSGIEQIAQTSGGGLRIIGNKIHGGTLGVLLSEDDGLSTQQLLISNNQFDTQTIAAIYLTQAGAGASFGDVVISNNNLIGSAPSAALLQILGLGGFSRVLITGNNFAILGDNTKIPIYLTGTTQLVTITGNIFGGTAGITNSIKIDSGVFGVKIADNFMNIVNGGYTFSNATTVLDATDMIPVTSLPAAQDGSRSGCSNCTIASPCAAGGTGALAKRLNGAWVCN